MVTSGVHDIELDAGPLRLAARAWGAADAAPVLALHGWLDNAASFDRLAPLLGGAHVVALDLPGHGHSAHLPGGCRYHFVDYAADVLAAADALGWDRFSLLGHSLGGAVATLLAAARPGRIERLALIEALGPLTAEAAEAPELLAQAIARAGQAGRRPAPVYASLEEALAARCAAGHLSPSAARPLVERGTVAGEDGLRWRTDPRLRLPSPYRLTEAQVLAFLEAIAAPTAVIVAEHGLLVRHPEFLERRVAALRDARVHRLPGNHHLHLEDAAPVAGLLSPFLRGERSGAA